MAEDQRNARIFGVLFLITFITSIPALALYQPVLDDPAAYIAGGGKDSQTDLGGPGASAYHRQRGDSRRGLPDPEATERDLSIGYVTARLVECTFIAAGIIFVLGIVSLRQDSPDASALAVSLAALKDWTFLLGPGFIVGWGNGLILGCLMYSSRLVPRGMAWLGLVGGPLIILTGIGTLFGAWDAGTTVPAITVIPEFLWELSLGIYCTVKGFKRDAPILSQPAPSHVD